MIFIVASIFDLEIAPLAMRDDKLKMIVYQLVAPLPMRDDKHKLKS